jgi:phosphomannomutase
MSEELITPYDIRGTEATGLTMEVAWNIGKALADWLPTIGSVVVVYHPTQQETTRAIVEGLRLQGRNVVDGGSGDKESVKAYITTAGLSGGVVIDFDDLEKVTVIELYREDGKLIGAEDGLREIRELILAGNFVPAAEKGQLTQLA